MSTATRGKVVSVRARCGKLYQMVSKHKTKIKQNKTKKEHTGSFFFIFLVALPLVLTPAHILEDSQEMRK